MDQITKRSHIHIPKDTGDKIADAVATGMGSWNFVLIQTGIVAVWIVLNVWILSHPFDPYPLILLNLIFSTQAAYASPLILMSQNRQAIKDRERDRIESEEVDKIFGTHELLLTLNQQQLQILNQQTEMLTSLQTITTALQTFVQEERHDHAAKTRQSTSRKNKSL